MFSCVFLWGSRRLCSVFPGAFFFYYYYFFTLLVQKRLSFTFWRVALIAQYSAFSLPLFHTVTILSVLLKVMFLCSTLWFHGLGVRNVLLLRKGNMTNCDCWIFPAPYYNKHYYNNNAVVNELMRVIKKEPLDSSSLTSICDVQWIPELIWDVCFCAPCPLRVALFPCSYISGLPHFHQSLSVTFQKGTLTCFLCSKQVYIV